jgi:hypothetical protein
MAEEKTLRNRYSSRVSPRSTRRSRLGRPIAVFYGHRYSLGNSFFVLLLAVVAISAPLGYGFWRIYSVYTQYGEVAAGLWSRPWFILSFTALISAILLLSIRLYLRRRYVAVYENGLHARLGFFRTQSWLWSEISGISSAAVQERFLHLPVRMNCVAILYQAKGKPIQFREPIQDMPDLIDCIKGQLYPRILPELRRNFLAGNWLTFGPVAIHPQGIGVQADFDPNPESGFKPVPWDEVKSINAKSGFMEIQSSDSNVRRVPIADIPNFEVMIDLIKQRERV